jgi:hypothetical protein
MPNDVIIPSGPGLMRIGFGARVKLETAAVVAQFQSCCRSSCRDPTKYPSCDDFSLGNAHVRYGAILDCAGRCSINAVSVMGRYGKITAAFQLQYGGGIPKQGRHAAYVRRVSMP